MKRILFNIAGMAFAAMVAAPLTSYATVLPLDMKGYGSATKGRESRTYTVEDMRRLTIECLQWILEQTEVPATQPESCGNYLLHDLPMCKWESARYLDRLQHDFHSEYTKLQITLDDGKVFADA